MFLMVEAEGDGEGAAGLDGLVGGDERGLDLGSGGGGREEKSREGGADKGEQEERCAESHGVGMVSKTP